MNLDTMKTSELYALAVAIDSEISKRDLQSKLRDLFPGKRVAQLTPEERRIYDAARKRASYHRSRGNRVR